MSINLQITTSWMNDLSSPKSEGWSQLTKQLKRVSHVLEAEGLSARFVVQNKTVPLGQKVDQPGQSVGFVFESARSLQRIAKRYRLIDFARAYINGMLRIDGDIADAVVVLDALNRAHDQGQTKYEAVKAAVLHNVGQLLPRVTWKFESLDHYQQNSVAYELFLDDWMQYTCGRFVTGKETITEAQVEKFLLINELATSYVGDLHNAYHLDVGCGWGGLISYFKTQFGTHSIGITNTPRQAEYARKRYDVDANVCDFRELEADDQKYDLITIAGMMEHLSPQRRDELLQITNRLLTDKGVVYLQCIGKPDDWIGGDVYRIAQEMVFPGHYVEFGGELRDRVVRAEFEVLEYLEHGSDYATTTALWVEAIEANMSEFESFIGGKQARVFLGYLAYASMLFGSGRGSLVRMLLRKKR